MDRDHESEVDVNSQPNYDKMWTAIEQEASRRKLVMQQKKSTRRRRKFVPAAIVFSCFMVIAVPTFAGVAMNWDSLIGGSNFTTALNNGFGQRYDLSVSNEGVTMKLNGVVTDGEKMKMIVSLDSNEEPTLYDGVAFEGTSITDESGTREKVIGNLNYDIASGKLLGIYETKDELQHHKKKYTLEAENLIFLKDMDVPLKSRHQAGDVVLTGSKQYPNIQIQSVNQAKNQITVRYNVSASKSDQGKGNPHLVIKTTNNGSIQGVPTQLPNEGSDLLIEQVFNLTEEEWHAAELHFNYIEETKRIAGKWNFDFKVDGKKASEAIYSRKLQSNAEFQQKTGITLDKLVITPLEIEVNIQEDNTLEFPEGGKVSYNSVRLVVGDKEIKGSYYLKGADPKNYQPMYLFQSPEWYKDWSQVPIKLILQDAVVTKYDPSKNWITIAKPVEKKQSAQLIVEEYNIRFTYYTDGKDLIVESESDSPGFKGVGQTIMRINDERVYPESVYKGMVSPSVNVDRYKNIAMDDKLELNPGHYSYNDSGRDMEVNLD
ncbi:RNA polymerase subunit sigma [Paenibacillus macquariensis subsp. defensor]|nr:RNA polymerase subunit sigma [Paenibacillus macquariensis subsp. defensor]